MLIDGCSAALDEEIDDSSGAAVKLKGLVGWWGDRFIDGNVSQGEYSLGLSTLQTAIASINLLIEIDR